MGSVDTIDELASAPISAKQSHHGKTDFKSKKAVNLLRLEMPETTDSLISRNAAVGRSYVE
jgi:hypothetical protein